MQVHVPPLQPEQLAEPQAREQRRADQRRVVVPALGLTGEVLGSEMALRWTAAGMLEAERQFRRIIGYRDLAKLAVAIERDLSRTTVPSPTEEVAILVTA